VAGLLITIGQRARLIADEAFLSGLSAKRIMRLPDAEAAKTYLQENLRGGDVVLVKGSRGLRLDRLVSALEAA
jgi:UDP-N-acetylmuramoyl-tripeptide--D-alanyl-D-alanine ligase